MNATTNVRKALWAHQACFSYKGHDFCCEADRRYVKKVTKRAARRLGKALAQNAEG
jgi:hypothetical protein